MIGDYEVITLCGSTKFKEDFIKAQEQLTLQGKIVISVGLFSHADNKYIDEINEDVKEMLVNIHLKKIDMSDSIMIIDTDDYIGESTRKEIEYAKSKGKFIYFYSHPEIYYDDVGGYHDSGFGYNPNGTYCGECSKLSCRYCDNIL